MSVDGGGEVIRGVEERRVARVARIGRESRGDERGRAVG